MLNMLQNKAIRTSTLERAFIFYHKVLTPEVYIAGSVSILIDYSLVPH